MPGEQVTSVVRVCASFRTLKGAACNSLICIKALKYHVCRYLGSMLSSHLFRKTRQQPVILLWNVLSELTRMSPKRLRCSVVGCNNEHSSRHLLLTSEPLKTQWITLVFEGNKSSDLPKRVYVRMNPASPTEEVNVSYFMNLCKSPFLMMC